MFMAVFFIKGKTYSSLCIALRVLVTFRKFFLQLFYPVRDVDHGLDAEVVIQVSEMRPAEESLLRLLMLLQYPPPYPHCGQYSVYCASYGAWFRGKPR